MACVTHYEPQTHSEEDEVTRQDQKLMELELQEWEILQPLTRSDLRGRRRSLKKLSAWKKTGRHFDALLIM
jgi:hypothetical protein